VTGARPFRAPPQPDGWLYPITITATNAAGSVVQAFTLTNDGAPTITSPATATFATGVSSTYT